MRNSRTCFSKFLIGAASLIAASTAALAGEQVLEFKLVTKLIDPKIVQAANIDGQTMTTSNDALDRAIVDEKRLSPPPVQQPEIIGTA
jgi:hypothetical protein